MNKKVILFIGLIILMVITIFLSSNQTDVPLPSDTQDASLNDPIPDFSKEFDD